MRTVASWFCGVILLLLLVFGLRCGPRLARAEGSYQQIVGQGVANSDLIALSSEGGNGFQLVTVIDPKSQSMAVYHIERTTGKITLKSVRNIRWDLLLSEFNGNSPLPREIKALLEQHQANQKPER